jgi:hypothetical protein
MVAGVAGEGVAAATQANLAAVSDSTRPAADIARDADRKPAETLTFVGAKPGDKIAAQAASPPRDGQHDFDFEFGVWRTHIRRLIHPLTGSTTWVDYDGTTMVREVWDGRANLVELDVSGSAGRIEGASLRLYDPRSRQWRINYSNSNDGALGPPAIGEFKDGRGEFYDQEDLGGRSIFVRFVISEITPVSAHFEQSYSADGGKTWEINWIATDTRVANAQTGRIKGLNGNARSTCLRQR